MRRSKRTLIRKQSYGGFKMRAVKGVPHIVEIGFGGGLKVRLGDVVLSTGRMNDAANGVRGVVFELMEPHTEGLTSDVIRVKWDNGLVGHYKYEDLSFPKTRSSPRS